MGALTTIAGHGFGQRRVPASNQLPIPKPSSRRHIIYVRRWKERALGRNRAARKREPLDPLPVWRPTGRTWSVRPPSSCPTSICVPSSLWQPTESQWNFADTFRVRAGGCSLMKLVPRSGQQRSGGPQRCLRLNGILRSGGAPPGLGAKHAFSHSAHPSGSAPQELVPFHQSFNRRR